jgi:hypothetical protein
MNHPDDFSPEMQWFARLLESAPLSETMVSLLAITGRDITLLSELGAPELNLECLGSVPLARGRARSVKGNPVLSPDV